MLFCWLRVPASREWGHRLYFSLGGMSNDGQPSLTFHDTENVDDRCEENELCLKPTMD